MAVLLLVIAAVVAAPALTLAAECLLACTPRRTRRLSPRRPRLAVIAPAHNEEGLIGETVRRTREQLADGDRLIVIADNCTDGTAGAARDAGAEVLVRDDDSRRGKGYAVRHAINALRDDPPEVVLSIDADCRVDPGAIDTLARAAAESGRPMQAGYRMLPPAEGEAAEAGRVSAFAVLVKNLIRPRGLQALGAPCLLTGSGMAFPWSVLSRVPHPEASIVEDMSYSVDLALAGAAPEPCTEATVWADLPAQRSAFDSQRTRWEHGHLATIRAEAPRLLLGFLKSGSPRLLALLLELCVPPLSLLLAAYLVAAAVMAVVGLAAQAWAPFVVAAGSLAAIAVGVGAAWLRFGRGVLPLSSLLSIPRYALRKAPLYGKFLIAPQTAWVRTARDPTPNGPPRPHFAAASADGDPAETGGGPKPSVVK